MTQLSKILFTGAPGSKWSGIAQMLETHELFNTTDRTPDRTYLHHKYSGHKGAYFGPGMEFEASTDLIESAYADPSAGTMIAKSHEWLSHSPPGFIEWYCQKYDAWFMMVYRPNDLCLEWWIEAGGFQIEYPNYDHYINNAKMQYSIRDQNETMLMFASQHDLAWHSFTREWVQREFGITLECDIPPMRDVLVTVYKP